MFVTYNDFEELGLISDPKVQRSRSQGLKMTECLYMLMDCTMMTFSRWRDHMLLTMHPGSCWSLMLLTYLLTY